MEIGVRTIAIVRFNYELERGNITEESGHQSGKVSLAFPDEIDKESEKIDMGAKMEININNQGLHIEIEIEGEFEVPNNDYRDKDRGDLNELVNSLMGPMLDKAKWYYALFFSETNSYMAIPSFEFDFS